MTLEETLYDYTNDTLKTLIRLAGDSPPARKDDLVAHLVALLTTPASLRELWEQMDDLSQKAVASAYHNDGLFHAAAFAAQYGSVPERPRKHKWSWASREPILMDLLIHDGEIPSDLMPLLADRVAPPDPFQITGQADAPRTVTVRGEELPLTRLDTEKTGLSDLLAYLHLASQGEIRLTKAGRRITAGSARKVLPNLTEGDFFALPDQPRAADTLRPFALDVFTREGGLVSSRRTSATLTQKGHALWQTRDPELLLAAFERWTHEGGFDELSRITAISGQEASKTRLTPPARRREQIAEALSWCPAGVWISVEEFLRALLIWHFDFDVEQTDYSHLKLGASSGYDHGWSGRDYWRIVNGLYVQTVLWEYLGTIGALDLLYVPAEEMVLDVETYYGYHGEVFSPYDGLVSFRINDLGAYLLGQAPDYAPLRPSREVLFSVEEDRTLTLHEPDALTPHLRMQLDLVAEPLEEDGRYRLTSQRLLAALEAGRDGEELAAFLTRYHDGPLPAAVTEWLERLQENSRLFRRGRQALFIKVKRKELVDQVLDDPVLGRFTHKMDAKTLVIPASREARFRSRLRELEYVLLP